ncbi:MAG: DUF1800 domain-containing protein [Pirellulales bacterium]
MTPAPATEGPPSWAPYRPKADAPWDLRRVVHLHRRAGFGATWNEIERDLAEGPEASLDRLLAGSRPDGETGRFEETAARLAEAAVARRQPGQLQAWWIYRMLRTADPLSEQLTLMWHNHFATSNLKVDDVELMWRQNEMFRRLGRSPFGDLLRSAVHDAALLVWLDAPSNRFGAPNENLARELLELFTLGVGNYAEADVKQAARVLTGWTVRDGQWRDDPQRHDPGGKTVLGRSGPWRTDDLVGILLDHRATAHRIAWRICDHFLGSAALDATAVDELAEGLRKHNLDIGWAVGTVLSSARFFDEASIGSRIVPPVDYVLSAVRGLEQTASGPSPAVLADWVAELGQELFYPPNVGGWPGGRSWLSPRTMIARVRFASELAEGRLRHPAGPPDVAALARQHGFGHSTEQVLDFLDRLLFGGSLDQAGRAQILSALDPPGMASGRLLARLLASTRAQLG